MEKEIGIHLLGDLCQCEHIPTLEELEELMNKAVVRAKMTPLTELTGTVLEGEKTGDSKIILFVPLEESHFSVHVFVPLRYVAVDLFTCGDIDAAQAAFYEFCKVFHPYWPLSDTIELPRIAHI